MQIRWHKAAVTVSGSAEAALDTDTANLKRSISSMRSSTCPSINATCSNCRSWRPDVFGDGSKQGGGGGSNHPGNQGPGRQRQLDIKHLSATENGPQSRRAADNSKPMVSPSMASAPSAQSGAVPHHYSQPRFRRQTSRWFRTATMPRVGRFRGGHTQVTSKSGTNDLHGSLFFKSTRPGLNAYQRWNGPAASNL